MKNDDREWLGECGKEIRDTKPCHRVREEAFRNGFSYGTAYDGYSTPLTRRQVRLEQEEKDTWEKVVIE